VILTPPARRRPIRTFTIRPDIATVRQALVREQRRGGQSFVVVPRIEEIDAILAALRQALPEFVFVMAHGRMRPAAVDDAMVRFASGEGDVLVSTSIIETGLDVPRANTMVVWNAELFGLAQLHQLRGRVGRGRAQGVCYLLSESADAGKDAAARRLGTLATLDRLGAGMEISARDLDARGAGDLVGEEQAGHLKLIGPGLYQRLLERALGAARGLSGEDWVPQLNLDIPSRLPADYIPEPELRIMVYSRFARASAPEEIDRLADELEDRFGPLPPAVEALFAAARLRLLCRRHGVARVDAGPQGIALTLRPETSGDRDLDDLLQRREDLAFKDDRLILRRATDDPDERRRLAEELVEALA
jgi:transcription-repair coupling factor (superfamily II helicase)